MHTGNTVTKSIVFIAPRIRRSSNGNKMVFDIVSIMGGNAILGFTCQIAISIVTVCSTANSGVLVEIVGRIVRVNASIFHGRAVACSVVVVCNVMTCRQSGAGQLTDSVIFITCCALQRGFTGAVTCRIVSVVEARVNCGICLVIDQVGQLSGGVILIRRVGSVTVIAPAQVTRRIVAV